MTEILRFENADLGYGGRTVLRGVDLSFAAGESVGLVGPNGSGKTTFLRAALGLLKPQQGFIRRFDARRYAYVPQADEINMLWPLTIRENAELPARAGRVLGGISAEEKGRVDRALEQTGLSSIAEALLRDASGGQRQRAVIAQALAQAPEVLFLDEPTKGLDVVAERDLLALIAGLSHGGRTIFLVSHSLYIPINYAQRILLFHNGAVIPVTSEEIVKTNKLEEIYGVPFVQMEQGGQRWAVPARKT